MRTNMNWLKRLFSRRQVVRLKKGERLVLVMRGLSGEQLEEEKARINLFVSGNRSTITITNAEAYVTKEKRGLVVRGKMP